jgi:hypothetical protein
MVSASKVIWVAAPYVTATDDLLEAQKAGKEIRLIVGLNDCTSPHALRQVQDLAGFGIRYFTRRFHAKLYIFDNDALVGSSNLTQGGLSLNREANICIDSEDELDELRELFSELWEDAQVLTAEKLAAFAKAWSGKRGAQDPDPWIEDSVGKSEPQNSSLASRKRTTKSVFQETLRRQIAEYGAAFREIDQVLAANQIQRMELSSVPQEYRTNRFLNWVRLSKAPGEVEWRQAPPRSPEGRQELILELGREWAGLDSDKTQIPEEYLEWLERVMDTFKTKDGLSDVSKEALTAGLLSLHAFHEQLRFVDGGLKNLPIEFWHANGGNLERVRQSLVFLLFGRGDFPDRLYEFISYPNVKLAYFGKFCALELFGTIHPHKCPPMNGRTAKSMRFLGYSVSGA